MVNAAGAAAKKEAAAGPEQPEITGLAAASDDPNLPSAPPIVRVERGFGLWLDYPQATHWAVVVEGYLTVWDGDDTKLATYSPGAWTAVELHHPIPEGEV